MAAGAAHSGARAVPGAVHLPFLRGWLAPHPQVGKLRHGGGGAQGAAVFPKYFAVGQIMGGNVVVRAGADDKCSMLMQAAAGLLAGASVGGTGL